MEDRKKMYMMAMALGVIVLIIVIIAIIAGISGKRLSYEKIESTMQSAAKSYYQSRENELPSINGTSVTISAQTLSDNKNMKSLEKIQPKGVNCSGSVIVTKNGEHYLYSPILNCGTEYSSKKLHDVITENRNIVISGDGLYTKENGYIFKGEKVNNLVQIDGRLWAIIDIDSEGYIRLISINHKYTNRSVWDNRYNLEQGSYVGINDYSVSRIKDALINLESNELYLSENSKSYVAVKPLCIGKRSESNLNINNHEECEELSEPQIFGLPLLMDVVAASLDKNCKVLGDASCNNYNYFSSYGIATWTLTGVAESTSSAYYVAGSSYIPTKASTIKEIIPVIYLSNNVMYASGEGTIKNPYLLK